MKRFQELKQRAGLAWRILRDRDSNLTRHAINEFTALGNFNRAGPDLWIAQNVVELVRVFSSQGHSGFSAPFSIGLFKQAASFEPLGPITGADSEWFQPMDGVWQNRRCSHVFKQADRFDGKPYDLNAIVFEEPSGCRFTGVHSMRVVEFPYTPRSIVVQVPEDATDVQKEMLAQQAWAAA